MFSHNIEKIDSYFCIFQNKNKLIFRNLKLNIIKLTNVYKDDIISKIKKEDVSMMYVINISKTMMCSRKC